MNFRKLTAAILSTTLIAGAAVLPDETAIQPDMMTAGAVGLVGTDWCGENVQYLFTTDETLYINGKGAMNDYSSSEETPWHPNNQNNNNILKIYYVKYVKFDDEVTHIGSHAFSGCGALENIEISDTVTSIGSYAFENCTSLQQLVIPESVSYINEHAFKDCDYLTDLTIKNPYCEIKYTSDRNDLTKNTVVHGYTGSTAEEFAEKNGLSFESLGKMPAPVYGDANLDGNVTIADSVTILQFLGNNDKYELSPRAKAYADCYCTGDGITGNDALTIQKIDAGLVSLEELPLKYFYWDEN